MNPNFVPMLTEEESENKQIMINSFSGRITPGNGQYSSTNFEPHDKIKPSV